MERLGMEEGEPIEHRLVTRAIATAQKRVETHNFEIRKHLLEYDDVMNKQREVIYGMRRQILDGESQEATVAEWMEDLVPTVLDAVKVSYPPDLAGRSLLGAVRGGEAGWDRLFARNDRNLTGSLDRRHKVIATPGEKDMRLALFDRAADPGETRDVAREKPEELRRQLAFVFVDDAQEVLREALPAGRRTPASLWAKQFRDDAQPALGPAGA